MSAEELLVITNDILLTILLVLIVGMGLLFAYIVVRLIRGFFK